MLFPPNARTSIACSHYNHDMTKIETAEVILMPMFGIGAYGAASFLPEQPSLGRLLLMLSALLLFQSLLRDLTLLWLARRHAALESAPARAMQCMCVESTLGMTGIVIGASVLGFGFDPPIVMKNWTWAVAVIVTLGTGFLIKDFIVQTHPLRIARDKDHLNIVVLWRR